MVTVPSTLLTEQYDEISKECKITGKPILIKKCGEPDLVVMSIDAYEKKQAFLELKEKLLDIELEQKNGAKYYSIEELELALRETIAS